MKTISHCLVVLAALAVHGIFAKRCLKDDVVRDSRSMRENKNKLTRAQTAFAFNMLGALVKKSPPFQNIFFSPYSTYNSLLIAYLGASNRAESELARLLGLQWASSKEEVSLTYRQEKHQLTERLEEMPLTFNIGSKIYFKNWMKVGDCWKHRFHDEIDYVDFNGSFARARSEVNNWYDRIIPHTTLKILEDSDGDAESDVFSTSGSDFRGEWLSEFDARDTKIEDFFCTTIDRAPIEMMHKRGTFKLYASVELGAEVVQIPYLTDESSRRQSEISMVIFLPPSQNFLSIQPMLDKLTPEMLDTIFRHSAPKYLAISIPKFELETNLELQPILRKLGVKSIFDDPEALSGFSEGTNLNLHLSKHVARIYVDEYGHKGVTAINAYRSTGEPKQFMCNRPFLFLIYDLKAKTVLFTGIYRMPNPIK